MAFPSRLQSLFKDPPPEFAFELSPAGLAWVRGADPGAISFAPLPAGTLQVNPLENNVRQPQELLRALASVAPQENGRRGRRAALVLPDFCARVTVLDFDTLPSKPDEQQALIRFRVKKTLPFDVDSAVLSYAVQPRPHARKLDVLAAAVSLEVASHYEQPFRAAGFQPGLVTVSALSALALPDSAPQVSPVLVLKQTGRVLSLSVLHEGSVRFFRCLELDGGSVDEMLDVVYPMFALIEDELGSAAQAVRLCGVHPDMAAQIEQALNLPVTRARSRWGAPGEFNAGLYGLLEAA